MSATSVSNPQTPAIPMIALLAIALMAQFFLSYANDEPYPSAAMPGFENSTGLPDDPNLIAVSFLRLETDGHAELFSSSELFESAPVNQQLRMMRRLDDMTGSASEWEFFDQVVSRHGLEPPVSAAELIHRDGYGNEALVMRIERS